MLINYSANSLAATFPSKNVLRLKMDGILSCRREISNEKGRLMDEIACNSPQSDFLTRSVICEALLSKYLVFVDETIAMIRLQDSILDDLAS